MDSPRGRIALISAAADGRIDLDGPFQEHIELCLGCRACETACPSGVQYGMLYEAARTAIEESRTPSRFERAARWLGLRQLMPHKGRLRLLARTMKLYQVTGIQRVVRNLNVLPKSLQDMEAILPPLPDDYPDYSQPAPAIGEKRGEVAFLYGCVQDAFLIRRQRRQRARAPTQWLRSPFPPDANLLWRGPTAQRRTHPYPRTGDAQH